MTNPGRCWRWPSRGDLSDNGGGGGDIRSSNTMGRVEEKIGNKTTKRLLRDPVGPGFKEEGEGRIKVKRRKH